VSLAAKRMNEFGIEMMVGVSRFGLELRDILF
jgi:hypothetical protein